MTDEIYPYLIQTAAGQPVTMRIASNILPIPVSRDALRNLMLASVGMYAKKEQEPELELRQPKKLRTAEEIYKSLPADALEPITSSVPVEALDNGKYIGLTHSENLQKAMDNLEDYSDEADPTKPNKKLTTKCEVVFEDGRDGKDGGSDY